MNIYVMILPDLALIFLALVDKVVVDIYARFHQISTICIEKYEESQSAILFLQ